MTFFIFEEDVLNIYMLYRYVHIYSNFAEDFLQMADSTSELACIPQID